jgi:hypothetical protein
MDIDEKKRKIEEVSEAEQLNVEEILKTYIECSQNVAKLLATLTQKVLTFEKMFNKDLFKYYQSEAIQHWAHEAKAVTSNVPEPVA